MFEKRLKKYHVFSLIFTMILGTLLHFTYEWFGNNAFVGVFSPINESVWEHLKLLFFPMVITTIIGYYLFKDELSNFVCSKTISIIVSLIFIVIFFYSYTAIIGRHIAAIDISSFFVACIIGEFISYKLNISNFKCNTILSIVILCILFLLFVFFTFVTPNLKIFEDPQISFHKIDNINNI